MYQLSRELERQLETLLKASNDVHEFCLICTYNKQHFLYLACALMAKKIVSFMFKSLHCRSPWLQAIFRELLIVTLLGMTRTWETDSNPQTRVGLVGAAAAKKTIDCCLPAWPTVATNTATTTTTMANNQQRRFYFRFTNFFALRFQLLSLLL